MVFICSNNTKKRIRPYIDDLGIEGLSWSMKPSIKSLVYLRKNRNSLFYHTSLKVYYTILFYICVF